LFTAEEREEEQYITLSMQPEELAGAVEAVLIAVLAQVLLLLVQLILEAVEEEQRRDRAIPQLAVRQVVQALLFYATQTIERSQSVVV
tara:strand:+ start:515 stop:778 length:264 start_codon:yes stop_codon:yes gene_type:complete